jgi:hypothetical protein
MSVLPSFPVEGGCICGAVRYRLTAPPLAVYACHCRDCQRFASGPYAVGIIVNRDDFVARGGTSRTERTAESGRTVLLFACAACACRIWHETAGSTETRIVRAGTLDDPRWAKPVAHIWTRSKLPWVELGDAPAFKGAVSNRQVLLDAWSDHLAQA